MIRPMPFWPSFEPCAKLTPVQVRNSSARIHSGGGIWELGGRNRSARRMASLASSRSAAAPQNPTIGETSRDVPTSLALAQLTPSPNTWPFDSTEFASPTPIIEPIRVWELEAGRPRYQVPRFQTIAETSSENTIAKPAADPTLSTNSTGSSAVMPNATARLDTSPPTRFKKPDQTTACTGRSECV